MKNVVLIGVVLSLAITAWAGSPEKVVPASRTMEYNKTTDVADVRQLKTDAQSLLTSDARLFVRPLAMVNRGDLAVRQKTTRTVMSRLRDCNNNIYALAINTQGVKRANTAVFQNGRVYLRATPSQLSVPVHVAAADKK